MAKLVAIDAGHGGVTNGKYTTAPAKQFFHGGLSFHNGGWFYEGVSNRAICDKLCGMLAKDGIRHIKCYHSFLDTSLQSRVNIANRAGASLFISNHSNASQTHQARGWEVFTTRGKTKSDEFATALAEQMKKDFGNEIRYRFDFTDGDPDKESDFFVLRRTAMPSILVENFFFDNRDDAQYLFRADVIEGIAETQLRTIKQLLS